GRGGGVARVCVGVGGGGRSRWWGWVAGGVVVGMAGVVVGMAAMATREWLRHGGEDARGSWPVVWVAWWGWLRLRW
nr:hypothetical protein [Tanacetum cinerariifolium]